MIFPLTLSNASIPWFERLSLSSWLDGWAKSSRDFDTIDLFTLIFFPADDLSPGLGNFQDLHVY